MAEDPGGVRERARGTMAVAMLGVAAFAVGCAADASLGSAAEAVRGEAMSPLDARAAVLPDGPDAWVAYVERYRHDAQRWAVLEDAVALRREEAARGIAETLDTHPSASATGRTRVDLVRLLGHAAHRDGLTTLDRVATDCAVMTRERGEALQRREADLACRAAQQDGRACDGLMEVPLAEEVRDAVAAQRAALFGLEATAGRYRDDATLELYERALNRVIDERTCADGAVALASASLKAHALDPAAVEQDLERRLSDRPYLAAVVLLDEPPGRGGRSGGGR